MTAPRQLELFDLPPDPAALIPSLRDIGYSFESAVADLVDNSIAAGARRVEARRVEEWLSSVECGRIFCAA